MMEDGNEKKEIREQPIREEIFSKAVRAGKRTYFFDVKATRRNEYYLTITESKKRFSKEGQPFYEKHKIFLYKEDFEKFAEGLDTAVSFINQNQPADEQKKVHEEPVAEQTEPSNVSSEPETVTEEVETTVTEDFTNVEFEDLEEKSE